MPSRELVPVPVSCSPGLLQTTVLRGSLVTGDSLQADQTRRYVRYCCNGRYFLFFYISVSEPRRRVNFFFFF